MPSGTPLSHLLLPFALSALNPSQKEPCKNLQKPHLQLHLSYPSPRSSQGLVSLLLLSEALNVKMFLKYQKQTRLTEVHITKYKLEILSIMVKVQNPTYMGTNTSSRTWPDEPKSWCSFTTSKHVICASSLSPRNAASKRSKAAWTGQPEQPAQLQFPCCWSHLPLYFQCPLCFFTAVSVCNSCLCF